MDIPELAKATNRTERDLTAKLQNDGYLREKADTTTASNQTVNHRWDGHFKNTLTGPNFDSEVSKIIIKNYRLPASNRPK